MTVDRKYFYAVWRRKEASIVMKLYTKWTWNYTISFRNNKDLDPKWMDVFFGGNKYLYDSAISPIKILWNEFVGKYDADIVISWWGISWVADAIKLWFARALILENESKRLQIKPYWLLKRDPRVKERKKFGLKKARKASKRSKR